MDFNLLDLTAFGRQEEWEDSPAGWPQTPPYSWWQLNDEYEAAVRSAGRRRPGAARTGGALPALPASA